MYFKEKDNTNIDDEFEGDGFLSKILSFLNKYKFFLLTFLVVVILVIGIILFSNKKVINYLVLHGEESITLYQGNDYVEPGFDAYNSNNDSLNSHVKILSTLDMSKVGEYEITYMLGEITKIRKVIVVEKPEEYTYIYLKTVNNSVNVYLKLGEKYEEPGYQVFNSDGKNLNSEVKISGKVDSSKRGTYRLVYSLVDVNNVTISVSRTVIVMDAEISLSLDTKEYTNKNVTINIGVVDNYFDYILLPNNEKVKNYTYSYSVSQNGNYTFKVYSTKGVVKEQSIQVNNIDKVAPTGSCKLDYVDDGSLITITGNDSSGISKYIYDGKSYVKGDIKLSSYIESAKVTIYDNAGNTTDVSCKATALPMITNISNDGVIVKINAKKVGSDISGYYFSYNAQKPDKEKGGYIATSKESIDVVRLPGTTYIWVEDKSGRVSKPYTISLGNEVLLRSKSKYKVLKGTKLSDYLADQGWSLSELNKLMARSVRAAGLYTKEGAATSAVVLEVVLTQKFGIKVPYWRGGKTSSIGAYSSWGMYRVNTTYEGYNYYGMDCDGLVNWSYLQTGINYSSILSNSYYNWSGIEYNEANGEVGDVLRKSGHVSIIIGKTDKGFIVAEAYGESVGLIINDYSYSNKDGYVIIKGERLIDKYEKNPKSEYPSGF